MHGLENVDSLVRAGRFAEALNELGQVGNKHPGREVDLFRMELMQKVGPYDRALEYAQRLIKLRSLTPIERGRCEFALGLIHRQCDHIDAARVHLQRSIALLKTNNDLPRACWSQLWLLLILAADSGSAAAGPLLAETRQLVTKAGDPIISATLHAFVGNMEARRGLIANARRHTQIGQRLLGTATNVWVEGVLENNLIGIAILECDWHSGMLHAQRALDLSQQCGELTLKHTSLGNLANLYYFIGSVEESRLYFDLAIHTSPFTQNNNACYESLAKTHLVQDHLDEASQYLDLIEQSIRTPGDRTRYANRYAQLTRAVVLECQGHLTEALSRAESAGELAQSTDDHILMASSQIVRAEILPRLGRLNEAVSLLEGLVPRLRTQPPDMHAQYERAWALALVAAGDQAAGRSHLDRALRTFEGLHSAPGQLDAKRVWEEATRPGAESAGAGVEEPISPSRVPSHLVQDLSALLLHAGRPELMARDLVVILAATGDVAAVTAQTRTPDGTVNVIADHYVGPLRGEPSRRFVMGESRGATVEVLATPRDAVTAHATLNAVAVVLGIVHELERARAEREERLTLWPIEELPPDDNRAVVTGRMRELMSFAQKVARTNASVLITGESGTGKEIIARAIHEYSTRAEKPFVPFNCAAIPRDMLESQLFGHRRGAFTGADRDHPGMIRTAREGTLFLDEIGEMGLDLQPKLLRFLESGEIAPLGETSPLTVDVRIIAATNAQLEQLVQEGRFREDLFYRLNVIRLTVPPLRERRDEIPALVHHFLSRAATEFVKGRLRIADEAMEHLVLHRWPGNVRQLQNEIRRVVALAEPDSTIGPGALSPDIRRSPRVSVRTTSSQELSLPLSDKLAPAINRVEREMIQSALKMHHGRLEAAARALGISRKGLYLKRQRLGL